MNGKTSTITADHNKVRTNKNFLNPI